MRGRSASRSRCRGRRPTGGSGRRSGGFEALAPQARQVTLRTDPEVLELAAGLKGRTRSGPRRRWSGPAEIVRLVAVGADAAAALRRAGAERPPGRAGPGGIRPVRGAGAERHLDRGRLHGPQVAGRKAYGLAFLDDHSRAVMAARWGCFEDSVRLAAA